MGVTKQQQLEWLAAYRVKWCIMSDTVRMSIYTIGEEAVDTDYTNFHLISHKEWQEERDKIETKAKDNSLWYTRGEKPPVGCECLIHHAAWCKDKYEKVKIAAITEEYLIVKYASFEQHYPLNQISFKPIQTRRDRSIKDMLLVLADLDGCSLKDIVSALYDAGYDKPFTQGVIE